MKISEAFTKAKASGQKLFIPYITAGDPDLATTGEFLVGLEKSGAGVIELGVPFSDPVADGPTIQRASERALSKNTTLQDILDLVRHLRRDNSLTIPLVLFSYFNPIYKMGLEKFCEGVQKAGINGVLIVDLPPEEAEDYSKTLLRFGIEATFLASPTTSDARLKLVNISSTGFVYYISRMGVTGAQKDISESLSKEISHIKEFITRPLGVGFGISTAAQAKSVSLYCDAVIVGSVLVELIEKNKDTSSAIKAIATLSKEIVAALR